MEYTIHPIAHIRTDFTDKFGIPRQSGLVPELTARIVFEPEYRDPNALVGIEGYDRLWLIWQFSTVAAEYAAGKSWRPTVRPPRLGGNERRGVFATRSPYRPNALGLSCVEPARRYSNPEDHRAAGLCRPQNCRIKQKNPGGCRGSFALSCICWQRHHATPRIFSTLFRTSAGSRPEPFTLPAISCASTSAGSGSAGFAATPWMVQ